MKLLKALTLSILVIFSITSCELFDDEGGLSTDEVVKGLKRALEISVVRNIT